MSNTEYYREYRDKNKDLINEKARERRRLNPEKSREASLRSYYKRRGPRPRKWFRTTSKIDTKDFPEGWTKKESDPKWKREYKRRYFEMFPEKAIQAREKIDDWRRGHTSILAARQRDKREKLRLAALNRLGGFCSCVRQKCWHASIPCGITDPRALSFNHKVGGGRIEMEKKSDRRFLREIAAGKRAHDIEVFCHNCNWVHARENGLVGKKNQ